MASAATVLPFKNRLGGRKPAHRTPLRRPFFELRDAAGQLARALQTVATRPGKPVIDNMRGGHGRRRAGAGDTFWQFRPFQPGDTQRDIDWRRSARSDQLFVRQREWETAETVLIWPDLTPSMDFRSGKRLPLKSEMACMLAIAAAIVLIRAGERIGLLGAARKPEDGMTGLERFLEDLETAYTSETDLPVIAQDRLKSSQLLLLSDFWMAPGDFAHWTGLFRGAAAYGAALHLLDPAEQAFPYEGRLHVFGPEGEGDTLIARAEKTRKTYRARLNRWQRLLDGEFRKLGWAFLHADTQSAPARLLYSLTSALEGGRERL